MSVSYTDIGIESTPCTIYSERFSKYFKRAKNIGKNMTELLTDPGHTRADLHIMQQAVARSMNSPEIPIPPAVIEAMPKIAGTILLKGKQREQIAAGKLLLAFMEYNKSLTPKQIDHDHHHVHEIGPVTETTIEAKRASRLARLAGSVRNG